MLSFFPLGFHKFEVEPQRSLYLYKTCRSFDNNRKGIGIGRKRTELEQKKKMLNTTKQPAPRISCCMSPISLTFGSNQRDNKGKKNKQMKSDGH